MFCGPCKAACMTAPYANHGKELSQNAINTSCILLLPLCHPMGLQQHNRLHALSGYLRDLSSVLPASGPWRPGAQGVQPYSIIFAGGINAVRSSLYSNCQGNQCDCCFGNGSATTDQLSHEQARLQAKRVPAHNRMQSFVDSWQFPDVNPRFVLCFDCNQM